MACDGLFGGDMFTTSCNTGTKTDASVVLLLCVMLVLGVLGTVHGPHVQPVHQLAQSMWWFYHLRSAKGERLINVFFFFF